MIVSEKLRWCFVHLPKTGGSSITAAMREHIEPVVPENTVKPVGAHGWQGQWHRYGGQHDKFSLYQHRLDENAYKMDLAMSVRSPFERLASHWAIKGCRDLTKPIGERRYMDPFDYLRGNMPRHCLYTYDDMRGPMKVRWHLRFEHLVEDFQQMCDDLSIDVELPHENRQQHSTSYFVEKMFSDDNCADFVHMHFSDEIERFEYQDPRDTQGREI